ncbi:hypothetical protein [Rubellicoccus peritrichatus]|uniref:Uncharacterized protein n=1 Tax=Rubellicoccus peritrichatus TaxID=3080537 RepID=A0AAQ3QRQ5_9BACT|nr:hypothetical protein [Puniceicoccus sp. CR14]WOO39526.1 hypothetical protein RZN69_12955 [Puniceicoccus sp. CR14]
MINRVIQNIADLPGVEGVCVFNDEAEVLLQVMGSVYPPDVLDDVSRRVVSLFETVDDNFVPCDEYVLRYPQKKLILRRGDKYYLLIVANETVNAITVRMVSNSALKHIAEHGIPKEAPPAKAPEPEPPTPPPTSNPTPERATNRVVRPNRGRTYRGTAY